MSADTVDDLQAAEDTAGLFASILGELLDLLADEHTAEVLDQRLDAEPLAALTEATSRARAVLAAQDNACRPTCGFQWGDYEDGSDDDPCEHYEDGTPACGCPCGHEART